LIKLFFKISKVLYILYIIRIRPQLYNNGGGYLPTNTNTNGANSIVSPNNNTTSTSSSSLNNSNNNNSNNNNNNNATMMMTIDPLEPIPVQHMNELFISSKEALLERMEIYTSTSNNWTDNVYA
jgi:hypothetical protein